MKTQITTYGQFLSWIIKNPEAACKMIESLTKQNKALVEALESANKSLDWYANAFAGWEKNSHEFEHFWRVELPSQIQEALAANEDALKEMGL